MPLISKIQFYRKWIEENSDTSNDKLKDKLLQFDNELKQVEDTFKSSQNPYPLFFWLDQIIQKHKDEFNKLQEANSLMTAAVSSDVEEQDEDTSQEIDMFRVPIGGHTLPNLPYAYDALEPIISRETMRRHHDIHHKKYVDDLNKAELKMEEARQKDDFDLINHWEEEAAFNGAGHYLHTIFWKVMSPTGGGEPTGSLLQQIENDFGSFENFKNHYSAAAEKVGVGWAMLVWSPRPHRLEILQAKFHQNLSQQDIIPLLPLDMWEHAYYLDYQPNKKKDYIKNWWTIVNWPEVQKRFDTAKQVRWEPH